jgi:peptide/nickel transport system ATP-binding protein
VSVGETAPLVEVKGISKRFSRKPDMAERLAGMLGAPADARVVHAVDGVDLTVAQGEVVGLVGESGCGKSTLGRMIAGILEKTEGEMFFEGVASTVWTPEQAKVARHAIQMIFQDPMSSLNPRKRVRSIIGEAAVVHGIVGQAAADDYVTELMAKVGLDPSYLRRFPHQFSGGQRQRIGIARAIAVKPRFLVCDEAIAALDVSIQAQVLNLFMDLREEFDLTYLFISHDLGVVEHLSDRVAIMYLGRIIELAPTEELYRSANHPYTQALLEEVPRIGGNNRDFAPVRGEIPSPVNPPSGCHFHPRCPHATDRCKQERPILKEIAPGRFSACHLNDQ